jgi:hypothetical protein
MPIRLLARFEQPKQRVALDVGQTLLMGKRDRLCAAVDAELRQHPLDVAPDRLRTDEEPLGDLRLGQTAGKQPQYLSLAIRQRFSGGIHVTSTGGSALAGSVEFTLYDTGTCTGNVLYTETVPVSGGSPQTVNTTNDGSSMGDVLVSASATVSWQAVFTSTNSVESSTAPCESTVLTIDNDISNP